MLLDTDLPSHSGVNYPLRHGCYLATSQLKATAKYMIEQRTLAVDINQLLPGNIRTLVSQQIEPCLW